MIKISFLKFLIIFLLILQSCSKKEEPRVDFEKILQKNEESAVEMLLKIYEAEKIFKERDIDANGVYEFWREDVAGLHYIPSYDIGTEEFYSLIPYEIAKADKYHFSKYDIKGSQSTPTSGYFFKMIKSGKEGFYICAFPSEYPTSAKKTFICNESGNIYSKDVGSVEIETLPESEDELIKDDWVKVK